MPVLRFLKPGFSYVVSRLVIMTLAVAILGAFAPMQSVEAASPNPNNIPGTWRLTGENFLGSNFAFTARFSKGASGGGIVTGDVRLDGNGFMTIPFSNGTSERAQFYYGDWSYNDGLGGIMVDLKFRGMQTGQTYTLVITGYPDWNNPTLSTNGTYNFSVGEFGQTPVTGGFSLFWKTF